MHNFFFVKQKRRKQETKRKKTKREKYNNWSETNEKSGRSCKLTLKKSCFFFCLILFPLMSPPSHYSCYLPLLLHGFLSADQPTRLQQHHSTRWPTPPCNLIAPDFVSPNFTSQAYFFNLKKWYFSVGWWWGLTQFSFFVSGVFELNCRVDEECACVPPMGWGGKWSWKRVCVLREWPLCGNASYPNSQIAETTSGLRSLWRVPEWCVALYLCFSRLSHPSIFPHSINLVGHKVYYYIYIYIYLAPSCFCH